MGMDDLPVPGLGSRTVGQTIEFLFTTGLNGKPTDLAGSPAVGVFKAGTTTPITAGVTLTQTYNSTAGLNKVNIVASVGNGYVTSTDYVVAITAGTLGGASMVGAVINRFRLGY